MLHFLFINLTFEKLLLFTIIFGIVIVLTHLIYWPLWIYRKKKKSGSISSRKIGNTAKTLQFLDSKAQTPFINFTVNGVLKEVEKEEEIVLKKLGIPQFKKYINLKNFLLLFTIIGIGLILYALNMMFNSPPALINHYPQDKTMWDDPRNPIVIEFDRPINPDKVNFKIIPEIDGEKVFVKSDDRLPFTRRIEFYPKTNIEPGSKIYLYVNGFFSLIGDHERYGHEVYFDSPSLPVVETTSIQEGAVDVAVNESFKITLDKDPGNFNEFEFVLNPSIELEKKQEGREFTLTPKTTLQQAGVYKLQIFRVQKIVDLKSGEVLSKAEPENIKEINFTAVKAPEIKSFSPSGSAVPVDSEMKIEFIQAMIPESVIQNLTINPEIGWDPLWSEENKTLVIQKKQNLSYGTDYTITLKAGIQGKANNVIEKEISHKFKTIGAVQVIGTSPSNGSTGLNVQSSVRVTFDQEVDKASAQSKFSISPSVNGTFSWDGNSMTFNPSANLAYYTKYTYTLNSGVKSIKGQDSKQNFSFSFTTITQTVTLPVPLYSQSYRFSCNLTATSMVLAYKGISKSQATIYAEIPKDSTPKSGGVWGDPDAGYVGNLDSSPGYGIHWGPIASYLNSRGVSASVSRNMSVSSLAKQVEAGKPVIVWVWNGASGPVWEHWTTPGGKAVDGLIGMHSWVVVGYIGSSDNPTSIIFNDPWGSRRTMAVSTFRYHWSFYSYTGVIVS